MDVKSKQLPGGNGSIPTVGLGTFTWFGEQGNAKEEEAAIGAAIDVGYRHFDCAWAYKTQESVGKAIEQKIKDGVIERRDVFITTKLWNTHHNPKLVLEELKDSLKQLRTDYVDMFLIHFPTGLQDQDFSGDIIVSKDETGKELWACYPLEDIWKVHNNGTFIRLVVHRETVVLKGHGEMEKCQRDGLTRNIGLSNFNTKQTDRILKCCTIKPSNMQIEITPYFSNERLSKFCKGKGMTVTAYSPLGARIYINQVLCRHLPSEVPNPLEDPVLIEIAIRSNKTVAQVILRFHLQNELCVVPKSITPERIKENIDVFDFGLSAEDMKKIKALDRNLRWVNEPTKLGHIRRTFIRRFHRVRDIGQNIVNLRLL